MRTSVKVKKTLCVQIEENGEESVASPCINYIFHVKCLLQFSVVHLGE